MTSRWSSVHSSIVHCGSKHSPLLTLLGGRLCGHPFLVTCRFMWLHRHIYVYTDTPLRCVVTCWTWSDILPRANITLFCNIFEGQTAHHGNVDTLVDDFVHAHTPQCCYHYISSASCYIMLSHPFSYSTESSTFWCLFYAATSCWLQAACDYRTCLLHAFRSVMKPDPGLWSQDPQTRCCSSWIAWCGRKKASRKKWCRGGGGNHPG